MHNTKITVDTRLEGEQIRRGLEDPQVRAFVRLMGILLPLQSDRARERVLRFIDDHYAETNAEYVSVFHG